MSATGGRSSSSSEDELEDELDFDDEEDEEQDDDNESNSSISLGIYAKSAQKGICCVVFQNCGCLVFYSTVSFKVVFISH